MKIRGAAWLPSHESLFSLWSKTFAMSEFKLNRGGERQPLGIEEPAGCDKDKDATCAYSRMLLCPEKSGVF